MDGWVHFTGTRESCTIFKSSCWKWGGRRVSQLETPQSLKSVSYRAWAERRERSQDRGRTTFRFFWGGGWAVLESGIESGGNFSGMLL